MSWRVENPMACFSCEPEVEEDASGRRRQGESRECLRYAFRCMHLYTRTDIYTKRHRDESTEEYKGDEEWRIVW